MPRSTMLAFVLVACATIAMASPVESAAQLPPSSKPKLPFKSRIGGAGQTGVSHIMAMDRARVTHIKAEAAARKAGVNKHSSSKSGARKTSRGLSSINVTNAVVTYTACVTVGGVARDLLIDTGSSNTWIGYEQAYDGTNCEGDFEVEYGSGFVFGTECVDTVTLSPDLVIANQSFGVAEFAYGFSTDGILGIGPVDLTEGTTDDGGAVPTVTDNLFAQGTIDTEAIGIFYAPPSSASDTNGELTFGGADDSKIVGNISYTSLTTTAPADSYWGVDQTVSYGNTTILDLTAGIVDTGTTLIYLATEAYDAYVAATGAVYDGEATGLLAITEDQYATLQPLSFNIGSAGSYALPPNGQIWPRALNAAIGGNDSAIYLVVADVGSVSGSGLDFIDGYTFLERFYTVYDTTNSRFGIAPTESTNATTN